MEAKEIMNKLAANRDVFEKLLKGVPPEEYTWRINPDKWSLLEIVCHLYDEEREDFRSRTRHILENKTEPFSAINPTGWVEERNYSGRDYEEMVNKFLSERDESNQWLQSVSGAEWQSSYEHPKLGRMTAMKFLVNWLAHDYLHFRQITRVKYRYLEQYSSETLEYAGDW